MPTNIYTSNIPMIESLAGVCNSVEEVIKFLHYRKHDRFYVCLRYNFGTLLCPVTFPGENLARLIPNMARVRRSKYTKLYGTDEGFKLSFLLYFGETNREELKLAYPICDWDSA